jgi:hypothetical protein
LGAECGCLQARLACARDLQSQMPAKGKPAPKKCGHRRKNFKIRVDTESRAPLYTPHQDGDAAGAALDRASLETLGLQADHIGPNACSNEATLFEN